jgi:hypothetical protein
MEVLFRNAQALFHEYHLPPTPPSSAAEVTVTMISYGSLFLSPEFTQYSEVQAMGPVIQPRPLHIHTSTQSTSSVSPPDSTLDVSGPGCLSPTLVPLLSPLPGFSRSRSFLDTKETPAREQVKHNTRSREAIFPTSSLDVVPPPPQSTSSRWLSQQRLYTLSLSPGAGSLLSDNTHNPLSSATSLQSAMGAYSPPPEERLR